MFKDGIVGMVKENQLKSLETEIASLDVLKGSL
jgi:hypothetical protein